MCGIAGFLSTGPARPGEGVLRAMGNALAHRGPDASGTHLTPDGRVGLSHRRLSILDLSPAGAQPMFSADGSRILSFNGEVYNFREIRAELEGKGHAFRGGSDTEVMLASFREWGVDAAVRQRIPHRAQHSLARPGGPAGKEAGDPAHGYHPPRPSDS